MKKPRPPRPLVFIGSSAEGLPVAEAIQVNLDRECEVVIWSQGVFGLSEGNLESLVEKAEDFDFAILVLTPDDLTYSRKKKQQSPRDNVLLELGLFIGVLGRERTYVVFERSANLKLPSDLAGVTLADFQIHKSGNLQASVGSPCTRLKAVIKKIGSHEQQKLEREANRALMSDRLQIFKEIARLAEAKYTNGAGTFENLLRAKKDVAKAELMRCESDKERLEVRKDLIDIAQKLVDLREAQFRSGMILKGSLLQAKADLLDAQANVSLTSQGAE